MTNPEFRHALAKEFEHCSLEALDLIADDLIATAGAIYTFKDGMFKISLYGREARATGRCVNALKEWIRAALLRDAPSEVAA